MKYNVISNNSSILGHSIKCIIFIHDQTINQMKSAAIYICFLFLWSCQSEKEVKEIPLAEVKIQVESFLQEYLDVIRRDGLMAEFA